MPDSCMLKQLKIKMANYTCSFTKLHRRQPDRETHMCNTYIHVGYVQAAAGRRLEAQGAKYRDISKLS